jgi:cellobiose transport system substrate-binding protein
MRIKRVISLISAAAVLAGLAGCGNTSEDTASGEKVVIKIQTFTNFGYQKGTKNKPGAGLYAEYERLHPNVKIQETAAATSDDARSAFNTAISTGSDAYDIYAAEGGWLPSIMAMPDKFVDLTPYTKSNDWVDWMRDQVETSDGKLLGAATDTGPNALCYRKDLFKKAGLPTDRDDVKKLLGGDDITWDSYFAEGKKYTEKTGLPWYDAMQTVVNSQLAPLPETFIAKDNSIIATGKTIKSLYDQITTTKDSSAHLAPWSDDWNSQFASDKGFATLMCPVWMLDTIKGNAGADFSGWDIASAVPGGGANQGGSWLFVPQTSKVKEEAAKLTAWLTAPKQQEALWANTSHFPSSKSAMENANKVGKKDSYFDNADLGKIFYEGAKSIKTAQYMGNQSFDIAAKFNDALARVDVTQEQTPEQSWKQFEKDVQSLS